MNNNYISEHKGGGRTFWPLRGQNVGSPTSILQMLIYRSLIAKLILNTTKIKMTVQDTFYKYTPRLFGAGIDALMGYFIAYSTTRKEKKKSFFTVYLL